MKRSYTLINRFSFVILTLALFSCVNSFVEKQAEKEKEAKEIKERTHLMDSISKIIDNNLSNAEKTGNDSTFLLAKKFLDQLSWSNKKMLTESDSIESLKQYNRVLELKSTFSKRIEDLQKNSPVILFSKEEMKLNNKTEPFYYALPRGDSLLIECSFDTKLVTVSVIGESTQNKILSKTNINMENPPILTP